MKDTNGLGLNEMERSSLLMSHLNNTQRQQNAMSTPTGQSLSNKREYNLNPYLKYVGGAALAAVAMSAIGYLVFRGVSIPKK